MTIEVYDNFLPTEVFLPIKEYIFGGQMPWYYMPNSVSSDDDCPQFSHCLYNDLTPISDVYNLIKPIFATLNPIGLYRVKFNATARTEVIQEKPLHYDVTGQDINDVPNHNICVLYMNDNNGYTYFEDGQQVDSKENRAVIFPSNFAHAGTSCTDADLRVVLNIDYCKW